jgi:integrase
MRVFRRTYKDKGTGEARATDHHYVEFRDHNRILRRWPAFESEKRSTSLGLKLEKLVECRRNHDTPGEDLAAWLDALPKDLRARMLDVGLIDARQNASDRPLASHLDGERDAGGTVTFPGWRQKLEAKGNTPGHVDQQIRRARRLLDGCGFTFWSDLSLPGAASSIETFLDKLRTTDGEIGGKTARYYVQAIGQFCRWMVRDRRARSNPLTELEGVLHADVDSEERRALTLEEMRWLLKGAKARGAASGLTAAERILLYRVAYETGFRAGQLRRLTCGAFDLDADPPTVTARAETVKRRQKQTQVLRPGLAADLRAHLANKMPDAPALRMPRRTADTLAADLAKARELWIAEAPEGKPRAERIKSDFLAAVDHDGRRVVFHSLRHTHGTALGDAGVPQKDIQASLHHATGRTTERYLHSHRKDRQAALSALPELTAEEAQAATGTDGGGDGGRGVGTGEAQPLARTGPITGPASRAEMPSDALGEGSKTAFSDAPAGDRTRTPLRASDFKSTAQPAPPPRERGFEGSGAGDWPRNWPGEVRRDAPKRPPIDAEPAGGIDGALDRLAAGTRRLCGGG